MDGNDRGEASENAYVPSTERMEEARRIDREIRDNPSNAPGLMRRLRDYPFLVTGAYLDSPVPDIVILPRAQWRAALEPVSARARRFAITSVRTVEDAHFAMQLAGELELADWDRQADRAADRNAVSPRVDAPWIDAAPAATLKPEPSKQLSFRLDMDTHARVAAASGILGVRPTVFARLMTLRGADELLAEHEDAA